jgi:anti-sigma factor RsiW
MECRHARRKISAYLDHELDAPSVRQLEAHIQQCMECRETLNDFRGLSEEVRSLPKIDPGPDFAVRMVRTVRDSAAAGAGEPPVRFSLRERLSRIVEDFMEVVSPPRSPATGALNEFNDFPPLSMGYIYFNLISADR